MGPKSSHLPAVLETRSGSYKEFPLPLKHMEISFGRIVLSTEPQQIRDRPKEGQGWQSRILALVGWSHDAVCCFRLSVEVFFKEKQL